MRDLDFTIPSKDLWIPQAFYYAIQCGYLPQICFEIDLTTIYGLMGQKVLNRKIQFFKFCTRK